MQQESEELSYVEDRHGSLQQNKNSVNQQMEVLSYDIEYFDRILAINKFLSYYTPKEVIINELNFQEGWEIQAYKKIGRDLVKVVRKEDEDLRVVRLLETSTLIRYCLMTTSVTLLALLKNQAYSKI